MADLSTVARPYARALFDIAAPGGDLHGWSEALRLAAATLDDAGASRLLARPSLTDDARVAFVVSIVEAAGSERLSSGAGRNFLRLLAENGRFPALPEISVQFDRLKAEAENRVRAKLVAATEVSDAVAEKVARSLGERLGRKVELEVEVDSGLIGGAIIRADDMVIDGSVRSRLQRLADKLIA